MDFDVNAIPDDWEALADAGRMLAGDMDTGRFALGDVANRCATRYGDQSLTKFAADIGMARAVTLREYARVSRRFDRATRVAFGDEAGLNWSHFRAALADSDNAELWLAKAADDGLTVAELARAIKEATGKPVPPALVWSGEARIVTDGERDWFIELPREGVEWHKLRRVTVKVYEVNADA